MWELALFFVAGSTTLLLGLRQDRLRIWRKVATLCGLQVVEAFSFGRPELKARGGRMAVTFDTAEDLVQSHRMTITVPGPPGFLNVRILPQISPPRRDLETGAPSFDGKFFIEGPPPLVLALLDAEMRRLLYDAGERSRLEISSGVLQAESNYQNLHPVLALLLNIGHRIDRPIDIPRRLSENAQRDPEAGVRLQNLLVLAREFPGNPETLGALRVASTDPGSVEIRLRAAKELGAEGRGVLLELALGLVDDNINAQAVSLLGPELPFERLKALLKESLIWRRLLTARACLEVLGQTGTAAAVEMLSAVLEQEYGELAPVAAGALAATGSPAAEPLLIRALDRAPEELPVVAAYALGRIGSAAAVLPLKEAAERAPRDSGLRRAARQAISEIQSRFPGASPGQLSLAGAEAGQLSLAEAEAGQLSLADDPAGRVSLSDGEREPAPEPGRSK